MMKRCIRSRLGFIVVGSVGLLLGPVVTGNDGTCDYLQQTLQAVPHTTLERSREFVSLWDKTRQTGCAITFETEEARVRGDAVPTFVAAPGTELFDLGWRMHPRYQADGPGTSLHGIQKDDALCLVYHAQPAHLADSGEIVASETITVNVQCARKPAETAR
jgi:hypothetical protein